MVQAYLNRARLVLGILIVSACLAGTALAGDSGRDSVQVALMAKMEALEKRLDVLEGILIQLLEGQKQLRDKMSDEHKQIRYFVHRS